MIISFEDMIKNDNDTITYVKAVGIMLMVLAHCSNFLYVYYTVYMFHMPLFFLVSGYCFKEKYYSCPHTFVWKRIQGLWWPFVKWSLLFLFLHNTLHEINIYSDNYGYLGNGVHKYSQSEIIGHSKSIIFLMEGSDGMVGGFWFLKSLFFGSLFSFFLLLFLNRIAVYFGYGKKSVTAFAGGIFLVCCLVLNIVHDTLTVLHISPNIFLAATFFCIGHFLAICKVKTFNISQSIIKFIIMSLVAPYFIIEIGNPFYETERIVPYMIMAVAGTWCVFSLPWGEMNRTLLSFMRYVGQHTMAILTWHFLSFKIVSLLVIAVYGIDGERLAEFPVIHEYTNRGWFVLYLIVGISMPLAIDYLLRSIKNVVAKTLCITR